MNNNIKNHSCYIWVSFMAIFCVISYKILLSHHQNQPIDKNEIEVLIGLIHRQEEHYLSVYADIYTIWGVRSLDNLTSSEYKEVKQYLINRK